MTLNLRATRRHAFSLIELLIAMSILTVMVLILLQFLVSTQRLWSLNRTNIRIYENSRVAFEIIERDLRSAMTSTVTDKQVGFYINKSYNPASAANSLMCTFVSSVENHDVANSRLCEISYKFHTQSGVTVTGATPGKFLFTRQMSCDDAPSGDWNFTGRPSNWFKNTGTGAADFETVVDGVESIEINFYDENDSIYNSSTSITTGTDPDSRGNMEIPYRVEVNLVLFEASMADQPAQVRFRTRRSFTKVIFLGDLQTN